MTVALLLVGYGHVARRFVGLLEESRAALEALDVRPVIVGVVTRRHGAAFDGAGLDARCLADLADGRSPGAATAPSAVESIARLRTLDAETRVLVETTTLDVQSAEPAISHVRTAFAAGAHVVTANKGPVALAYRALADEATRAGVSFLFEGAVMDGIPVFNLVRETLPACDVLGFRGVLNSTTNYIIGAMDRGEAFDAALRRMQEAGVAEADPSLDVDGWDAAAKTAALANVLMDARITPADVDREGIGPDTAARAAAARRDGRCLKLVASAARVAGDGVNARVAGGGVNARVALAALPPDDPLAQVDGQANALELDTWPAGRIVVTQRDGGLEKTAYALVSDLVTVARRVRTGRA
jgi:homoserine dehydrogenase